MDHHLIMEWWPRKNMSSLSNVESALLCELSGNDNTALAPSKIQLFICFGMSTKTLQVPRKMGWYTHYGGTSTYIYIYYIYIDIHICIYGHIYHTYSVHGHLEALSSYLCKKKTSNIHKDRTEDATRSRIDIWWPWSVSYQWGSTRGSIDSPQGVVVTYVVEGKIPKLGHQSCFWTVLHWNPPFSLSISQPATSDCQRETLVFDNFSVVYPIRFPRYLSWNIIDPHLWLVVSHDIPRYCLWKSHIIPLFHWLQSPTYR